MIFLRRLYLISDVSFIPPPKKKNVCAFLCQVQDHQIIGINCQFLIIPFKNDLGAVYIEEIFYLSDRR